MLRVLVSSKIFSEKPKHLHPQYFGVFSFARITKIQRIYNKFTDFFVVTALLAHICNSVGRRGTGKPLSTSNTSYLITMIFIVPGILIRKFKFFKRKLVFNVEEEAADIKRKLRLAKVKEMQRANRMSKLEQMTGCAQSNVRSACEQHEKSGSFFLTCPNFEQISDEEDLIDTHSDTGRKGPI